MNSSYPYFKVARLFEVDYGKVLDFIDKIESKTLASYRNLKLWELKALDIYNEEQYRRKLGVG